MGVQNQSTITNSQARQTKTFRSGGNLSLEGQVPYTSLPNSRITQASHLKPSLLSYYCTRTVSWFAQLDVSVETDLQTYCVPWCISGIESHRLECLQTLSLHPDIYIFLWTPLTKNALTVAAVLLHSTATSFIVWGPWCRRSPQLRVRRWDVFALCR